MRKYELIIPRQNIYRNEDVPKPIARYISHQVDCSGRVEEPTCVQYDGRYRRYPQEP
jgi:hypothetical protein